MNNPAQSIEKLKAVSRMFDEVPTGAIADSIQALEKQIAKKPIDQENRERDHVRIGKCKSCEKWWVSQFEKYCPGCGQALDWSQEVKPKD